MDKGETKEEKVIMETHHMALSMSNPRRAGAKLPYIIKATKE
jgi:hypothetical protein